jgi:hypothetical protein
MANTLSATTALAVEELAAHMRIHPNKLRLAIGLAAAPGCTVVLGRGLTVRVEIVDEANLSDDALIKLVRLRMAARRCR